MPAIGNVVINDGQSTPAAHTFAPQNIDANGVASWKDRSSGVPTAFGGLDLSLREPTTSARVYRVQGDVIIPTVADGSNPSVPAGTVLYTTRAQFQFFIPESSTLQERKNIIAYTRNFLADASVTAVVQNLENVY